MLKRSCCARSSFSVSMVTLSLLYFLWTSEGHTEPSGSSELQPSISESEPDIASEFQLGRLEAKVGALENASSDARAEIASFRSELDQGLEAYRWMMWAASLASLLGIGLLGLIGFIIGRRTIDKLVQTRLEQDLARALSEQLPKRLAALEHSAQNELLRIAQVLSLHAQRAYSECLKVSRWDQQVSSLRSETLSVRHALIDSLYNRREDRSESRMRAWEALGELRQDDVSIATARLYLKICCSYKKFPEGEAYYNGLPVDIRDDGECRQRAATILRRLRKIKDALALIQAPSVQRDMTTLVTEASLLRDLGRFQAADALLTPTIRKIIAERRSEADGAHYVLTSYLANLIDLQRANDGIRVAQYTLATAGGAVVLFAVARFLRHLPIDTPERDALIDRVRHALDQQDPGEALLRAQVQILLLEKKYVEAEHVLHEELTNQERHWSKLDHYFLSCMLADVVSCSKKYNRAIDLLTPLVGTDSGGEAEFRLAVAFQSIGDSHNAGRWLKQAISLLPKWAILARSVPGFSQNDEIADLLAEFARAELNG